MGSVVKSFKHAFPTAAVVRPPIATHRRHVETRNSPSYCCRQPCIAIDDSEPAKSPGSRCKHNLSNALQLVLPKSYLRDISPLPQFVLHHRSLSPLLTTRVASRSCLWTCARSPSPWSLGRASCEQPADLLAGKREEAG
jgi:hypothetical protein